MSARRTGVLGGAFDPIHFGHLHIAEAVRCAAPLERVLFVPMAAPAHRETHASAQERCAMTELAIADNAAFALDSTGFEQPAPAYTADTLARLREKFPDDAFYFIAGIDSLVRSRWRRLDEVARSLERFYVVPREGVRTEELDAVLADLPADLRARFSVIDVPLIDLSSTAIRELVKARQSIRYLAPDAIVEYIRKKGLYQ